MSFDVQCFFIHNHPKPVLTFIKKTDRRHYTTLKIKDKSHSVVANLCMVVVKDSVLATTTVTPKI